MIFTLMLVGASAGCSVRDCDDDSGETGTSFDSVSCAGAAEVRSLKVDHPVYADPAESYLPADQSHAATITIRAEKGAAGARIRVDSEPPDHLRLDGSDSESVLLQSGADEAFTTLRVTSSTPGTHTLIVSAEDVSASTTVKVAGPPAFVPAGPGVTVRPGQTRDIEVAAAGRLRECWAEKVPEGLGVTLAGQDLAQAPPKASEEKTWTVTMSAAPTLVGDSTVTLRCRDRYAQESSLAVTIDG